MTLLFWAGRLAGLLLVIGLSFGRCSVGRAQGRTALYGLSFSSDSKHFATCGDRVRVFETATGNRLKEIDEPWAGIGLSSEIAFSPAEPDLLVVGPRDGPIRVLRLGQAEPVRKLEGHDGMTSALAFTRDGKSLATSSIRYIRGEAAFGKLRYWDVESGRLLHSEDRDDAGIDALSISDDGKQIAFCTRADLEVYDTESWGQIGSVTLPAGNLQGEPFGMETAFGKGDEFVIISGGVCVPVNGGCRTTGLLWKLDLNGSATLMGDPRGGYCRSVSFTPDRERFVSGHEQGASQQIFLVELDGGNPVWTIERGSGGGLPEPFGLRIAPDGKVAAWCTSGRVHIVDAANGKEVRTIKIRD